MDSHKILVREKTLIVPFFTFANIFELYLHISLLMCRQKKYCVSLILVIIVDFVKTKSCSLSENELGTRFIETMSCLVQFSSLVRYCDYYLFLNLKNHLQFHTFHRQ